ncbi:DUF3991 and TOPRIM domain-containing protein [Bhargavaea beijingensis]|uniref:DUF3991 and TOPRIM domain-containing protein n=1 Tax=Bhargavaea beijingensis TaxID=426756 RepID=UPI002224F6AE|nr:DUF3991 and TOPRIM domain-containing protein [Bhargavaea beijingensis]MCW1929579.1 DUF3991 and toprim domain-containing protein [Bhargavaea beijingensis]
MNKAEIDRASKVHVLDYLQAKGEKLVKSGNKYYHPEAHDSLKINVNGNWFWNSRGEGGYGPISLARIYYNLSFQHAVRDINNQSVSKNFTHNIQAEKQKTYAYPKQYERSTQKHTMDYLVNERKIDKNIVDFLIRQDLLAEDKLKNCVFKWKTSDGKIIGADRQGTAPTDGKRSHKHIDAFSKSDGGFRFDIGTPDRIAIFESPIDALSYLELKRPNNIRLASMSGLKDPTAVRFVKDLNRDCIDRGDRTKEIILAVDNDEGGKEFVQRMQSIFNPDITKVDIPHLKDWNLVLQNQKNMSLIREHHVER